MEIGPAQLIPLLSGGGTVAVILYFVKSWTGEIKRKVEKVDERVQDHGERIAACESENEGFKDRLNRCELRLNGSK